MSGNVERFRAPTNGMVRPGRSGVCAAMRTDRIVLAASLALIALATLVPTSSLPTHGIDLGCLLCGDRGTADALLNVALFLPLGWSLAGWRGVVVAALAGAALSGTVELAQVRIPGRFSTVGDIVWNTAGAALGAGLRKRPRLRRPAALATGLLGLGAPLVLLAPDPPPTVYWGQWTASFGNMAPYRGRVLAARVGGVAVPSRRSDASDTIRAALARDAPVEVSLVVGPVPPAPAPIFSIYDGRRREIFFLGADGPDVMVWRWTLGRSLRLDDPALRWPDALGGVSPGDTATIRFFGSGRAPCLEVRGPRGLRGPDCRGPGPGAGWTLLLSAGEGGRETTAALGLLWSLLVGALLGSVSPRAATRSVAVAALAAVALLVAWRLPWLEASGVQALALVAGAALGGGLLFSRGGFPPRGAPARRGAPAPGPAGARRPGRRGPPPG